MKRTLAALLVMLGASAHATDPENPPWEANARGAIVHVESAWAYRIGVVVHNGNTVWAYAGEKDFDHDVTVKASGEAEVDTSAYVYHDGSHLVWWLTPEKGIGRAGLEISTQRIDPGMVVYTFGRSHPYKVKKDPLVRVLVSKVDDKSFSLAADDHELRVGAPVLDADGRLLGVLTTDRRAVPASVLGQRERFMERCAGVNKIFGIRAGAEIASPVGGDSAQNRIFGTDNDVATLFEVDLGMAIWDRLGLVASIGFVLGDTDAQLTSLPARDGLGPAVVSSTAGRAVRVGFDAQWRQLLVNAHAPLYLDLTVGALYSNELVETNGPRLRSTDPDCDPSEEACPLLVEPGGDISNNHIWDMRVGADIRWGPLLLGYRFLPGIGDAVQAHQITIGLQGP